MVEDKDRQGFSQLPTNATDQLQRLPSREIQERIMQGLYADIISYLSDNHISIHLDLSIHRVKSTDSILLKLKRRGAAKPILDIYGIRLILPFDEIYRTVDLLKMKYPTPDTFPGGVPSFRDFHDTRTPWNPHRQEDYRAIHQNIVFIANNSQNIAEVQIMTPGELEVAIRNRPAYDKTRDRYDRSSDKFPWLFKK